MQRQKNRDKAVKYTRLSGKKALEVQAYRQARIRFEAVRDWATDDAFESPSRYYRFFVRLYKRFTLL